MSVDIYECAAGVAGVDCRVGLDKRARNRLIADLSVNRTDDSGRHGLSVAECVSDCDDIFTDLEGVGITQCRHFDLILRRIFDLVQRDGDHRQVVAGICSLELGIAGLLVDKQDSEVVSSFHHVVICHNEKFRVGLSDNDAGTGGFSLSCECLAIEILHLFRKVIIYGHDRGHYLIYDFRNLRIRRLRIGDDQAGFVRRSLRTGCRRLCLLLRRIVSCLLLCRIISCLLLCRIIF